MVLGDQQARQARQARQVQAAEWGGVHRLTVARLVQWVQSRSSPLPWRWDPETGDIVDATGSTVATLSPGTPATRLGNAARLMSGLGGARAAEDENENNNSDAKETT